MWNILEVLQESDKLSTQTETIILGIFPNPQTKREFFVSYVSQVNHYAILMMMMMVSEIIISVCDHDLSTFEVLLSES